MKDVPGTKDRMLTLATRAVGRHADMGERQAAATTGQRALNKAAGRTEVQAVPKRYATISQSPENKWLPRWPLRSQLGKSAENSHCVTISFFDSRECLACTSAIQRFKPSMILRNHSRRTARCRPSKRPDDR